MKGRRFESGRRLSKTPQIAGFEGLSSAFTAVKGRPGEAAANRDLRHLSRSRRVPNAEWKRNGSGPTMATSVGSGVGFSWPLHRAIHGDAVDRDSGRHGDADCSGSRKESER